MKLSVIIPVYNESKTILNLLKRIEVVSLPDIDKEVIIVDDGSTDGTKEILNSLGTEYRVLSQPKNHGKGAALIRGFKEATGDIVIVQDADLEYDPRDYKVMLQPIIDGDADVVYGSRFVTVFPRRVLYFSHYIANKILTLLSNALTGLNISDMETCYKAFKHTALNKILPCLTAKRFGIEVEITAQIAKHKLRVYEVGISYRGRTYEEGKKINWKDGVAAIWHIFRFNILVRK